MGSRRFARVAGRRSRSGGGFGGSVLSQRPPLPSVAVEYWHGELGASSANAVGQIQGITLPGQNTPLVAPDPGFFNGRAVYQASTSGNKCWLGSSLATVLASGTRPWVFAIGRWRTAPGAANQRMSGAGRTGSSDDMEINLTAGNVRQVFSSSGLCTASDGSGDTAVHRFKAWTAGTTANFTVDASNSTGTGANALPGNITGVAIGCSSGGLSNVGDVSVAFYLLCSAKPSAAEEAALDAWAIAYWGSN